MSYLHALTHHQTTNNGKREINKIKENAQHNTPRKYIDIYKVFIFAFKLIPKRLEWARSMQNQKQFLTKSTNF